MWFKYTLSLLFNKIPTKVLFMSSEDKNIINFSITTAFSKKYHKKSSKNWTFIYNPSNLPVYVNTYQSENGCQFNLTCNLPKLFLTYIVAMVTDKCITDTACL